MALDLERRETQMDGTSDLPIRKSIRATVAVVCVASLFCAAPIFAGTPPDLRCQAAKEKAAGRYAKCVAVVQSKAVKTGTSQDTSRCVTRLQKAFAKAEAKGDGACLTSGDAAATMATIDACIGDATTDILNGVPPPGAGGAEARCDSRKTKESGRYLKCLMRARAKATRWDVFVDPTDTDKCAEKSLAALVKNNEKDPTPPCSVLGDELSILASADACSLDFSTDTTTPQTKSFAMICDAGIAALQIPMDLTVTPGGAFEQGMPQTADTQVTVLIEESLVGTLLSLGATEIQLDSATTVSVVTGASGGPAGNVVLGTPFLLDLTVDTDVPPNGTAGPVLIVSDLAGVALTVDPGATSVDFELDEVSVELSMVPVLSTLSLSCTPDLAAGNEPVSFAVP
jgi:hypothetical protein